LKNIISINNSADLHKYISYQRFKHSGQVSLLAERLCIQYGTEPDKGRIAGLMHDIAREMSDELLLELAMTDGSKIMNWERNRPVLLHGRAGAVILKRDFGINDSEVLEALRNHVVGKPGMNLLSKIIFVADFLEPTRIFIDPGQRNRIMSMDIDPMLTEVLNMIFYHLKREEKEIAPPSISLYKELQSVKFR